MISLEHISKAYGSQPILQDLSLTLEQGQKSVLSGKSGCGKTTLLRIIAGLEAPDTGRIGIDGRLASAPHILLAPHLRGLGIVFQQPALWPHMTVRQQLEFVAGTRQRAQIATDISEISKACGIEDLLSRRPGALSGGQARRVALARALVSRPRYLLLDEPTSNLDSNARSDLNAVICDFVSETGAGLLYISHDAGDIAQIGGRHLHLSGGRLS